MSEVRVELRQGSDALLTLTIEDDAGDPINLTGYAAAAWGVTPAALADQLAVTVASAAAGQVQVALIWDDDLLAMVSPGFRVRITAPADDDFPAGRRTTTDLIRLVLK